MSRLVRSALAGVQPDLISASMLDGATSPLNEMNSQLQNYANTGDPNYIRNAEGQADGALNGVASWTSAKRVPSSKELREAAESYQNSVLAALEQVRQRADEVSTPIEGVRSEVDALRTQSTELQGTINDQKSRLDQAIAQFQQQFSTEQSDRGARFQQTSQEQADAFNEATNGLRTRTDEMVREVQDRLDQQITHFQQVSDSTAQAQRTQADVVLAELKDQEDSARKLVDVIGAIGISGGYGAYAEAQRNEADRWRWVVIAALAVVGIAAVVFLWEVPSGPLSWQKVLSKLIISAPFLAIAGYAAQQSGRHRENERQARRTELELAALEPYLALLPDDQRNAIKGEIAGRLFAQPMQLFDAKDDNVGTAQLLELLRLLLGAKK